MIEIPLTLACFGGYILAARKFLHIPLRFAPLCSISLLGCLLFLFGITNNLENGATFLIVTGFTLFIALLVHGIITRQKPEDLTVPTTLIFLLLLLISFLYTRSMPFSVMDDYVYWGIIGKYLHIHNHLPDSLTSIMPRHLAYTPGPALIHYLFFRLVGTSSQPLTYFAQNILFISALFVVADPKRPAASLFLLCSGIILTTLQFGSVFAKLSPDFLLAAFFFAALWVLFSTETPGRKLLVLAPVILFTYLLKEVGLFLAAALLTTAFFFFIFSPAPEKRRGLLPVITGLLCIGGALFLFQSSWQNHCREMGFSQLVSPMNHESILQALRIGNKEVRTGMTIFLKAITIGPADRLKLPYLFWYTLLFFCWRTLFKDTPHDRKPVYTSSLLILALFFSIYLLLIYFMQMVLFQIGTAFDHALGVTRYVNIYFGAIVLFSLATFFLRHRFSKKSMPLKWLISALLLCIILLPLSRNKRLQQDALDLVAARVGPKITDSITIDEKSKICAVPASGENLLGIRLLYYLQPAQVNYTSFPREKRETFQRALQAWDYCFLYEPEPVVVGWIEELSGEKFQKEGFYKIISTPASAANTERTTLEKIF